MDLGQENIESVEPDEVEGPQQGAVRAIEPRRGMLPVRGAVGVATGGFVAGATTIAVVKYVRGRRSGEGWLEARRRRKRGRKLQPLLSKSFLIDVHLLDK